MDLFAQVQQKLREYGIETQIVEHPPALTTEQADAFIEGIEGVRTKTMFLTNKKEKAFYLVIMDDAKRLDMDAFKELVGEKRVKMASESCLYDKMLLPPGVVSPFGLLNNAEHDIAVYIDREIVDQERMSFHPNTNEKTLFIHTRDLFSFLTNIGYPPTVVEL